MHFFGGKAAENQILSFLLILSKLFSVGTAIAAF
jgi:hypothetical protein